jgi:hypothetical protein
MHDAIRNIHGVNDVKHSCIPDPENFLFPILLGSLATFATVILALHSAHALNNWGDALMAAGIPAFLNGVIQYLIKKWPHDTSVI